MVVVEQAVAVGSGKSQLGCRVGNVDTNANGQRCCSFDIVVVRRHVTSSYPDCTTVVSINLTTECDESESKGAGGLLLPRFARRGKEAAKKRHPSSVHPPSPHLSCS